MRVHVPLEITICYESNTMKTYQYPNRKAFTLVELLTVIAIIGILSAILIPTIGKVMDTAKKSASQSNIREIAKSYILYANDGGRPRTINKDNLADWATTLAQYTQLNDPRIWILGDDPMVESMDSSSQPFPVVVGEESESGVWSPNSDFTAYPVSFTIANAPSSRAPASTTPLIWTRGLNTAGGWNAQDHASEPGVYGEDGGHVGFLDGHVEYFKDLKGDDGEGKLVQYGTSNKTANIEEAISTASQVSPKTLTQTGG